MDLDITATVSKSSAANPHDIRLLKIALNRLGYYTPDADIGLADFTDAKMFTALKAFQKDRKLDATGSIRPGDETEDALTTAIEDQPLSEKYIWRTCGDDKVRSGHAAREGKTFSWIAPPEGGHPGLDHNCRCWAEPMKRDISKAQLKRLQEIDPPIEPVYPEDFLNFAQGVTKLLISRAIRKFGEHTAERVMHITYDQLKKKFKHAEIFGIEGNQNNKKLEEYAQALKNHIQAKETKLIKGTYMKKEATHFLDIKTKINVIKDGRGAFKSAWILSDEQFENVLRNGKLGGGK